MLDKTTTNTLFFKQTNHFLNDMQFNSKQDIIYFLALSKWHLEGFHTIYMLTLSFCVILIVYVVFHYVFFICIRDIYSMSVRPGKDPSSDALPEVSYMFHVNR